MDDKDLFRKMSSFFEDSKKRKITDFDTGLLNISFEPITGSPEERYEKWCARLINIATRLENIELENNNGDNSKTRSQILKDIDTFFDIKLPKIMPNVSDYSQEARVINIEVQEGDPNISCVPESLESTLKSIREEQYTDLINQCRKLVYRALARLKKVFSWHREEWMGEIDYTKEFEEDENNGRDKREDFSETRPN